MQVSKNLVKRRETAKAVSTVFLSGRGRPAPEESNDEANDCYTERHLQDVAVVGRAFLPDQVSQEWLTYFRQAATRLRKEAIDGVLGKVSEKVAARVVPLFIHR